jgi:hypothetical protein
MPSTLKPDREGKKQPIETEKAAEHRLDESAGRLSDQLGKGSAISVDERKTVCTAELTRSAAAPSESSESISSDKKPPDVTSAARTLERNSGDLQGPGRKTTDTQLTEKTISESENQNRSPQSRQSHFPHRYLAKETLKELEHEL